MGGRGAQSLLALHIQPGELTEVLVERLQFLGGQSGSHFIDEHCNRRVHQIDSSTLGDFLLSFEQAILLGALLLGQLLVLGAALVLDGVHLHRNERDFVQRPLLVASVRHLHCSNAWVDILRSLSGARV